MDLRQTIELALFAAARCRAALRASGANDADRANRFASRFRTQSVIWQQECRALRALTDTDRPGGSPLAGSIQHLVVEVLATETLARFWGGWLKSRDRRQQRFIETPAAHSVLTDALAARQASLELVEHLARIDAATAGTLDRHRRQLERWTDLLLGPLVVEQPVAEFAYNCQRAVAFGTERRWDGLGNSGLSIWELDLLFARSTMPPLSLRPGPGADLRQEMLHMLPVAEHAGVSCGV